MKKTLVLLIITCFFMQSTGISYLPRAACGERSPERATRVEEQSRTKSRDALRPMSSAQNKSIIFDDVLTYRYLPLSHDWRPYLGVDIMAFPASISIGDIADSKNDEKWSKIRELLKKHLKEQNYNEVLSAINHITPNSIDAMYKAYDAAEKEGQSFEDKISIKLKIVRTKDFIKVIIQDQGAGIPLEVLEGWKEGNFWSHDKNRETYFGQHGDGTLLVFKKMASIGAKIKYSTFYNDKNWILIQNIDGNKSLSQGDSTRKGTELEIAMPLAKIALTGATGFLGINVSQILEADASTQVSALIRTPTKTRSFSQRFPRLDHTIGNLLDIDSLHNLMRGNNVFINVAADSSTNIRKDSIVLTAEIIAANVIGPALALMAAHKENNEMRKIFISSFDVDKVPPEARPWLKATTTKIANYIKEYIAIEGRNPKTLHALSIEIATEFKKETFNTFSYPVSKALMDSVLLELAEELKIKNMILLRIMGLVGQEMRISSNSGFLIKLIDAILSTEYFPAGKKLTPYKGSSASLISASDVAKILVGLAKINLDDKQSAKPIIVELGGKRITWEDVVDIIVNKAQVLTGLRGSFLKNVTLFDPPKDFVNVERNADLRALEQLLGGQIELTPIKTVIENLVEAEFQRSAQYYETIKSSSSGIRSSGDTQLFTKEGEAPFLNELKESVDRFNIRDIAKALFDEIEAFRLVLDAKQLDQIDTYWEPNHLNVSGLLVLEPSDNSNASIVPSIQQPKIQVAINAAA